MQNINNWTFLIFLFELLFLGNLSKKISSCLFLIFLSLTKNHKVAIILLSIIYTPGTFIHEFAHAFAATILFVKFGKIEFTPEIKDEGVKLGSVQIEQTDPFRRAIIGFAPVFVGLSLILSSFYYLSLNLSYSAAIPYVIWFIFAYLVFVISNTMFSSKKDLEGSLFFIAFFVALGVAFYLLKIMEPLNLIKDFFLNQNTSNFMLKADIIMMVPILIDLIIYLALKSIKKRS